jgi:murein DD-endopeptidase MepM/ murein hydrolase activator NlpD
VYLQSLLDVLAHPLGDRRPDLRHFRPDDAGGSAWTAMNGPASPHVRLPVVRARPAGGSHVLAWELLALALWGLLTVALVVVLAVVGSRRTCGLRLAALLVGAGAAVTSASAGAALATATPRQPDRHDIATTTWSVILAPATGIVHVTEPRTSVLTAWDRLLRLEESLATEQDRLAVLEGQMRQLVSSDVDPVSANATVRWPSRLAWLLTSHQEEAAAYQQCLENEYALYRQVADDPETRAQLFRGATSQSDGRAVTVVSYNLQMIDTLLSQERAIARAEAMLARYGWSGGMQAGPGNVPEFIAPEAAPLTQAFGPSNLWMEPPLQYGGVFYPHFHTGIDLAAPLDTPLHAAADGLVLLATASRDVHGRFVGYGNYVLVAHAGGFVTLYGHLARILVHVGDVVRQGDPIGLEGSTGWSTGPHVHFEIRHGHEFVDPLLLIGPRFE